MKKRVIITIAFIFVFLAGLSVLLYPMVSDYINSLSQSRVIANYSESLAKLSQADYSEILEAARAYNEKLMKKINRFKLNEEELAEYYSVLDFTGTGIIGTIEIQAIKASLPIYLGTEENVLQVGIGHLKGSSLPIGGVGTHSVVSGHRGLPSSTLLTNADLLEIGDVFVLRILNETLYYEIDQRVIVEPDNFEYLKIDPDMDYCTLLTCTPYGINSHRLLLRGCRIFPENESEQTGNVFVVRADARRVNAVVEYAIAAVPVLLISLIYIFIKYLKSKGRR